MIVKNKANILAFITMVLVGILIFGLRGQYLGFYADDAGFLLTINSNMSASELFSAIAGYVPGRNLHMVWQYIITILAGGSEVENLAKMHYLQAAGDCINALLLYMALLIWGSSFLGAFAGALTFLVAPNHGETHFWLSALPMNIVSTFFILALLIAVGVAMGKYDRKTPKLSILVHFVFIYLIFFSAIFTYDQTSPVALLIITLFSIYSVFKIREKRLLIISLWVLYFGTALSVVFWKALNPGGGPGFFHLSIHHIFVTFAQSLISWLRIFSLPFNPYIGNNSQLMSPSGLAEFFPLIVQLSQEEVVIVLFLTALSMMTFYNLSRVPRSTEVIKYSVISGVEFGAPQTLIIGGILFFLFAYLPGYIWFLSPRHSYLPSIGVAMIIAGAISFIPLRILAVPSIAICLGCILGYIWAGFFSANLIEKQLWISSYDLRKQMYEALSKSFPGKNSGLLLVDFPNAPVPGAPPLAFLTGESGQAIPIITRNKVSFERFVLHPVPARSGYFIRTEEGRWGENSLGYIPDDNALVMRFNGYYENQLHYSIKKIHEDFSTDKFYTLRRVSPSHHKDQQEFSVIGTSSGYRISVPALNPKKNETYVLLGLEKNGASYSKAKYSTHFDPEKFLVPVDLGGADLSDSAEFELTFNIPMDHLVGFAIYRVAADRAHLIGEAMIR